MWTKRLLEVNKNTSWLGKDERFGKTKKKGGKRNSKNMVMKVPMNMLF